MARRNVSTCRNLTASCERLTGYRYTCGLTVTLALDTLHDIFRNLIFRGVIFCGVTQRFAGSTLHLATNQKDKLNTFEGNAPTHRKVFWFCQKELFTFSVSGTRATVNFIPLAWKISLRACLLAKSSIEVEGEQREMFNFYLFVENSMHAWKSDDVA